MGVGSPPPPPGDEVGVVQEERGEGGRLGGAVPEAREPRRRDEERTGSCAGAAAQGVKFTAARWLRPKDLKKYNFTSLL